MRKALLITLVFLFFLSSALPALAYDPRYLFTDQEKDSESGLYNFDAREYNPNIGRFNQPDPVLNNLHDPQKLKEQTGQNLQQILADPQKLNTYSYARSNPIRYVDPKGEWFKEFFTGRQSWTSFQSELGDAAMYASPLMSSAIDHPYITGAITGILGGLAAAGGSYLLGQGGLMLLRVAPLAGNPLVKNVDKVFNKIDRAAKGAYDIAASGGKNAGIIKNAIKNNMTVNQIQQSIDNLRQNAMEHLNWVKDPSTYSKYNTEFIYKSAKGQVDTLNYWYGEAQRYIAQSNVYKGILENLQN
jgi:RHS repeat-associated protein